MKATALPITQSREEWLAQRRIGGSDAAAIVGLDPWRSPYALWAEMTGQVERTPAGEAAYWGTVLEDAVARHFAKVTGWKVQKHRAVLAHPVDDFMTASLDRLVLFDGKVQGFLEVKTTGLRSATDWTEDEIPPRVLMQVQHYLHVTQLPRAWVAVLIGGQQYRHMEVEPDADIIAALIEAERDFWRRVREMDPPEVDGTESTSAALRSLYPIGAPDEARVLPQAASELLRVWQNAHEMERDAKSIRETAENGLKQMLGTAELGVLGTDEAPVVSWKTFRRKGVDTKRLLKERPELAAEYASETAYRRFIIKGV